MTEALLQIRRNIRWLQQNLNAVVAWLQAELPASVAAV